MQKVFFHYFRAKKCLRVLKSAFKCVFVFFVFLKKESVLIAPITILPLIRK